MKLQQTNGLNGKSGIFRAITVNRKIIGNISIEQNISPFHINSEIGYFLLQQFWSKGIMTKFVETIMQNSLQRTENTTHKRHCEQFKRCIMSSAQKK